MFIEECQNAKCKYHIEIPMEEWIWYDKSNFPAIPDCPKCWNKYVKKRVKIPKYIQLWKR